MFWVTFNLGLVSRGFPWTLLSLLLDYRDF